MLTSETFEKEQKCVFEFYDFVQEKMYDSNLLFDLIREPDVAGAIDNGYESIRNIIKMLALRDMIKCLVNIGYYTFFLKSAHTPFILLAECFFGNKENIASYYSFENVCDNDSLMNIYEEIYENNVNDFISNTDTSFQLEDFFGKVNYRAKSEYRDAIVNLAHDLSKDNMYVSEEGKKWADNLFINNTNNFLHNIGVKLGVACNDDIDEKNYNKLLDAVRDICDFRSKLLDTRDLVPYLEMYPALSQVNCEEKYELVINQIISNDLYFCYEKLGHQVNIHNKEGYGVYIYWSLLTGSLDMSYDSFLVQKSEKGIDLFDSIRSLVESTIHSSIKLSNDCFDVEDLLYKYDKELCRTYILLLYRFAHCIAEVDENIDAREQEWLDDFKRRYSLSYTTTDEIITDSKSPEIIEEYTSPTDELNSLIGLNTVKAEVVSLSNFIKMKQLRDRKGLKSPSLSYHCVFTGNPGTGKTTVARILANILKELGVIKKGHLVETDRSGLVAEYVGQTAVKTNAIIDSALDGVLFVDEAYSLVQGGGNDYGREAISTLLKRMEDDRDRLVVILAGYTDDMKDFISSNPGLKSRFTRYIEFPDYTSDELISILERLIARNEYKLTTGAQFKISEYIESKILKKGKDWGNARFIRNLFERMLTEQANRIVFLENITDDALSTIDVEDIDNIIN